MNVGDIDIQEVMSDDKFRISIIGVGGGGNNMVRYISRIHKDDLDPSIKLIVANTDKKHMDTCEIDTKIILGNNLTGGKGAGMKPDVGKKAAEESFNELKNELQNSSIVIVATGLGGGTGTGASPVVVKAAKEAGALTIAVVTKPFTYEGKSRIRLADAGLEELREVADSIIVIQNEKLLTIIDKASGYSSSMEIVDSVLERAISGITNIVLKQSNGGMNVDFNDMQTVMGHKGLALMGIGEGKGSEAALDAVKNAIESPLFDDVTINGAKGLIINVEMHPEYPMVPISEAIGYVNSLVYEYCITITGTAPNPSFEKDFIRVSIIATGFEEEEPQSSPQVIEPQVVPSKKSDYVTDPNVLVHRVARQVSNGDAYSADIDFDSPAYLRYRKD